jgi:hypothetical protein
MAATITSAALLTFIFWRPIFEITIDRLDINHESGFAYILPIVVPPPISYAYDLIGDSEQNYSSNLIILENGTTLGPSHSVHAAIRQNGKGLFSHWHETLVFSTSDNTDPRTNNRDYVINAALRPSPFFVILLSGTIALLLAAELFMFRSELAIMLRFPLVNLGVAGLCIMFALWHPRFEFRIAPHGITAGQGYSYVADLSNFDVPGYEITGSENIRISDSLIPACSNFPNSEYCSRSTLALFQDGVQIGPANSLHNNIEKRGHGSYSHWGNKLLFSTASNSDPRVDGSIYTFSVLYKLKPHIAALFVLTSAIFFVIGLAQTGWVCILPKARLIAKASAILLLLAFAPLAWAGPIIGHVGTLWTRASLLLLGAYFALVVLCFMAIVYTMFLKNSIIRVALGVVFILSFAVDQTIFSLSGWHVDEYTINILMREYREAPDAVISYGYTIGQSLVLAIIIGLAYILPAPNNWVLPSRYSLIAVGAILGAAVLSIISPPSAASLPSPVSVAAQVLSWPLYTPLEAGEREDIDFDGEIHPRYKKVVLIVDESVRGDVLGINNSEYDNTPFLSANGDIINFGGAVSASNCSAESRLFMRTGLTAEQLPDGIGIWRNTPTFWQYAHKAGFETVFIDGFREPDVFHSYMNAAEAREIDDWITETHIPEYDRDMEIANDLRELLQQDKRMFIHVNKYGVHFPYSTKYDPSMTYEPVGLGHDRGVKEYHAIIIKDYHKALRWSVDGFFAKIVPDLDDDTLIIYTSDHGQALFEGGYEVQHCSTLPNVHWGEGIVPLFAVAGRSDFAERLKRHAALGFNRASHFDIFPTLLLAFGYPEAWVRGAYGHSLLDFPTDRPRKVFTGPFWSTGDWLDIEGKIGDLD